MQCAHAGQPLLPVHGATEPIHRKSSNQIAPKPGQLATNGFHKCIGGVGWGWGGGVCACSSGAGYAGQRCFWPLWVRSGLNITSVNIMSR